MNLIRQIESAELQFQQLLEDFFISIYDERSLPSHGIDHHRRVWRHAKKLIKIFPLRNNALSLQLPSKLIIASYLHDIGMSVDHGIRHGQFSSNKCKTFLEENNLNDEDYIDVLETIENHDLKDYTGNRTFNELHTILSAADDLDAFGFIGIYRYSEIYLLREIYPGEIGKLVIENATKRFDHFIINFGKNKSFASQQRIRFKILLDYFTGYNSQVSSGEFNFHNSSGYWGVMKIIISLINEKKEIKELLRDTENYNGDPVIKWFLEGIKSELYE
jgi:HD superfamily phosphodiesterase